MFAAAMQAWQASPCRLVRGSNIRLSRPVYVRLSGERVPLVPEAYIGRLWSTLAGGSARQFLYSNHETQAGGMKLQRTTEYALQIMVFLSSVEKRPLSSNQLHRSLGIPRKYLQRLLTKLSQRGLIRSTRGRKGGYVLTGSPRQVSLLRVVESVENLDRSPRCLFGFGSCPLKRPCALHDHWDAQHRSLVRLLGSTRLSDLAAPPGS